MTISIVDPNAGALPGADQSDSLRYAARERRSGARLNGLDGFRALAVTVVALFHFGAPGFSGGWIGPELFFVLSGYLITTLLLDRSEPGGRGLSLTDFWLRRIKRLYPAVLFLVASLVAVVALLDAIGSTSVANVAPGALASESIAALAYYANWHLIVEHVGYFGQSSSLLKHTWSLAIEEQFYLVWPLLFVLIRRSRRWWRPVGLMVAGCGALASAFAAAVAAGHGPINRVYYGTETNAFHLLVGVTLAFAAHGWVPAERTKRLLGYLTLPATAAIVVFVGTASDGSGAPRLAMFRGGELALDLFAATLILSLVFGPPRSPVSRLFNLRPVVWIGSVSYGLYLWHYPLSVILTPSSTGLDRLALTPLLIAATVLAAAFSYSFVEVVVRETLIASRFLRRALYGVGFAGSMALVGAAPWLIRPL